MQYLVTPTGDIVGADPVTLRRLAGTMVSNGAMAGFLIRNFGYGGISCVGNSMSVRIAPSRLRLAAQGRIAGFIRDCKPGRVSLAYYCGGWQFEIIPGGEAALERIAQLVIKARNDGGPQTYISEPRALESLVKDHPFKVLISRWRDGSGSLDIDAQPELVNGGVGGRYTVLDFNRDTGGMYFERLGNGFGMYRPGWTDRFIGQRVEDQPDMTYGRAVANCWRNAYASGGPHLADVDALITDPLSKQTVRGRYKRLSLPLRSANGGRRLLCASLLNDRIDFGL